MVRHIIMFKFKDVKNEVDKTKKLEKMKSAFSPMKSKIDVVQSYEIGINMKNTDFSYDFVITSEYKSWEDLEIYIHHPEHQKAIEICKYIEKEKAVVDYEY